MSDGIYSAASGAVARTQELDVLAHNLANASSTGFRAQDVAFSEVLANAGNTELRQTAAVGTRVKDGQGALTHTGRALDVALEGPGYFAVQSGAETLFTRNGHFALGSDGTLLADNGVPVRGVDGPIVLDPEQSVTFGEDGGVFQNGERVAQLQLSEIAAANLSPAGGSLLRAAQGSPMQPATALVRAQTLEGSNTNVLSQMTQLITTSRLFDATMNAIDTYKELDAKTAQGLARR